MQNVELACSKTPCPPLAASCMWRYVFGRLSVSCRDVREGIPSWQQAAASYFSHLSREKSLRPSSIWVYLIYIDTQLHWLDSKKLTKPYSPHPGSKKRGESIVESRRHEPILHRSYTSQNVMWSSGHFSTYITRVLITVSVNLSCIWLFAKGISIVRHMGLKYVISCKHADQRQVHCMFTHPTGKMLVRRPNTLI
jgi:hypothetical protein